MAIQTDLVQSTDPMPPVTRRRPLPDWMLTLALCAGVTGLGETLVASGLVSRFVLPAPSSIPSAIYSLVSDDLFVGSVVTTILEAASGFAIATCLGILLGAAIAEFRPLERILYPYLVALQTMPKIALAPLLLVWFGFGPGSKIAVAAVISIFPVLVNTVAGLKASNAGRLDVLRALGAGRWDCFRLARLPNALPFIFAGLSTAVMFSLTGALVGEFVGSSEGLGYLIVQANSQMDIPRVFAIVLILAAIGSLAFTGMQVVRRRLLFWMPNEG